MLREAEALSSNFNEPEGTPERGSAFYEANPTYRTRRVR